MRLRRGSASALPFLSSFFFLHVFPSVILPAAVGDGDGSGGWFSPECPRPRVYHSRPRFAYGARARRGKPACKAAVAVTATVAVEAAVTAAVAVHGSRARSSNFSGGASGKDEREAARCVSRGAPFDTSFFRNPRGGFFDVSQIGCFST